MAQRRSIFEEVTKDMTAAQKAPQGGMIARGSGGGARRGVRLWLIGLASLVVAMILIGGLTRLTDSGLSITRWNLVFGTLPPLSNADWQHAFAQYQGSPEFRLQNSWMQLADFKPLYWWEWGHRLLGRVIGLYWIAGFLGFLAARKLPRGWWRPLLLIGALIGIQGAVGWWMVASGLTGHMVDVASYRLATHLGLAFIILGLAFRAVLMLGKKEAALIQARRLRERRLHGLAGLLVGLAFLQILLGALAAGIDAGTYFNDWPWMAGQFFPPDAFSISPAWQNFFENPGLVQFMHRISGYTLVLVGLAALVPARRAAARPVRRAFLFVAIVLLLQMVLGITVVLHAAPLPEAISHQFGAIVVWLTVLIARFRAGYPPAQSVRS